MRVALLCFLLASMPTCSRFKAVTVSAEQSGTTLELKRGQEFGVRLKVSADPALSWHLTDRGGAMLVGQPFVEKSSFGSEPVTQLWRFRADRLKTSTLKMELRKTREKDAVAADSFALKLSVVP